MEKDELKDQYDDQGNAKYYDTDRINDIVKMERIWGTHDTMIWCEITSFKYRMRMGKKLGQLLEQELMKAQWYERMAQHLQAKIGTKEQVFALPDDKCGNPFLIK